MANRQGTLHKYFYKAADPAANEMDVAERPAERQDLEAMFAAESARADAIQQQQRQLEAMQRAWGVLKPHPFKQGSISTEHRSVSLHEGCVWCSSIPASSVGITTFFIRGCVTMSSSKAGIHHGCPLSLQSSLQISIGLGMPQRHPSAPARRRCGSCRPAMGVRRTRHSCGFATLRLPKRGRLLQLPAT